jgi:hypothetical protein
MNIFFIHGFVLAAETEAEPRGRKRIIVTAI